MALWSEIDRLRKDPEGFRTLAKGVARAYGAALTDWERDFLSSIQDQHQQQEFTTRQSERLLQIRASAAARKRPRNEEFTTRQSEKLLQIRDDYEMVTKLPLGLSVRLVLAQCVEGRADLPEEREEWILKRYEQNPNAIRRKDVGILMWCGRQVGAIDPEPID
jgi:hypothetical protein